MELRSVQTGHFHLERRAATLMFPGITMLMVVATLFGIGMNGPVILGLLVFGVVFLGLPHGSLDPLVARGLFAADRRFTMVRFLISYVLIAGLCVAGWLAAPNIALSLFLMISALHFGTDWQQRGAFWGRVAYGACVVTVPTLRHAEAVREIYVQLGATAGADMVNVSEVVAWVAIAVAFFSLRRQIRLRRRDWLELVVILISGIALQPLVFFICYFCLLHSPRHLVATSRNAGLRGLRAIASAVAPPVGATLLLAVIVWRFLPAHTFSGRVLGIVFIGLAALTVPHMLLTAITDREQGRKSGPQNVGHPETREHGTTLEVSQ